MLWPPSEARSRAVAQAAADPALDWEAFARTVDRHRAAAFAHDGLTRAGATAAPAAFRATLARRAAADGLINRAYVREGERLVAALRDAGLEVMVLKGAGLVAAAYGDLGVRQIRDLDLLVRPEALGRAGEICEAAGYVRLQPPPGSTPAQLAAWMRWRKDILYRHGASGLTLELHYRPTLSPGLAARLDLWSAGAEVTLPGGGTTPAATGEALYAYLCLHGGFCAWFRLKWLADIAALTAGLAPDALAGLHEAARARGAGRASAQALLLVEQVFDRPLPPDLRRRIVSDRTVRRLVRFALAVLSDPREPEQVPLRSTAIQLHRLLLIEDWRDRIEDVRGMLVDWPLVFALPLPRPLWFLYPLLRGPAWALRKLRRRRPSS